MKINISNIQHFSVGDGEGIRTTLFVKGCNLHCPWCHNPENLSYAPVQLHYKNTGKTQSCGRCVETAEILPQLLEDRDFFEESGGGVTFSGGEIMLQAEAAAELAALLKQEGVCVLIDTAGCVSYQEFEKLNGLVGGYLFDVKTADAEKYWQIGGKLELVAENLQRLLADKQNVTVRIPLIPEFNTDTDSIAGICSMLSAMGIKKVELLPFHRLGSGKYEALDMVYAYKDCKPLSKESLAEIRAMYETCFEVKMEG